MNGRLIFPLAPLAASAGQARERNGAGDRRAAEERGRADPGWRELFRAAERFSWLPGLPSPLLHSDPFPPSSSP